MTVNEIYDSREVNKLSLETFFLSMRQDSYSYSVEDLIPQLEKELEDSVRVWKDGQHIKNNKLNNWFYTHALLKEKLLALVEMQIIFRYKNLEIDIKRIIEASYGEDTKVFYRWESLRDFLKTKKILLGEVNAYNEVNQLRLVSNVIKHSGSIKNLKSDITEFKNLENASHNELLLFYRRVSPSCDAFITSLAENIFNDLYHFDDKRLDEIAQNMALRMDKDAAERFIEKLKAKY